MCAALEDIAFFVNPFSDFRSEHQSFRILLRVFAAGSLQIVGIVGDAPVGRPFGEYAKPSHMGVISKIELMTLIIDLFIGCFRIDLKPAKFVQDRFDLKE